MIYLFWVALPLAQVMTGLGIRKVCGADEQEQQPTQT